MIIQCFSAMVGFGPGWTLAVILVAATAAATYLLTNRSDRSIKGVAQ